MRKNICCLLILGILFSTLPTAAQTFVPAPDTAQEIMTRTTFVDAIPQTFQLKRLQTLAALQIMTFSDKQLHPERYMTEDEVLRILYRIVGVSNQARQSAETDAYRLWYNLGERDTSSHSDGEYLYAKQSGLMSEERFCAYFCSGAITRNTTAMRYDVYLWMAKLFGIGPESDETLLTTFSDASRIQKADRPYFAALVNHGCVSSANSLSLYYPVSREWFLHTLDCMEPYFIEKMGYQKREGEITAVLHEDGYRQIILETADEERDVIRVPLSETKNQLAEDIAVLGTGSRQITACLTEGEHIWYYTHDNEVAFIVVQAALAKPLANIETEVQGTLYYYDADMRMAVIRDAGEYIPLFLTDNAVITVNGASIPASELPLYYDKTIQISAVMRYENDLLSAKVCRISD